MKDLKWPSSSTNDGVSGADVSNMPPLQRPLHNKRLPSFDLASLLHNRPRVDLTNGARRRGGMHATSDKRASIPNETASTSRQGLHEPHLARQRIAKRRLWPPIQPISQRRDNPLSHHHRRIVSREQDVVRVDEAGRVVIHESKSVANTASLTERKVSVAFAEDTLPSGLRPRDRRASLTASHEVVQPATSMARRRRIRFSSLTMPRLGLDQGDAGRPSQVAEPPASGEPAKTPTLTDAQTAAGGDQCTAESVQKDPPPRLVITNGEPVSPEPPVAEARPRRSHATVPSFPLDIDTLVYKLEKVMAMQESEAAAIEATLRRSKKVHIHRKPIPFRSEAVQIAQTGPIATTKQQQLEQYVSAHHTAATALDTAGAAKDALRRTSDNDAASASNSAEPPVSHPAGAEAIHRAHSSSSGPPTLDAALSSEMSPEQIVAIIDKHFSHARLRVSLAPLLVSLDMRLEDVQDGPRRELFCANAIHQPTGATVDALAAAQAPQARAKNVKAAAELDPHPDTPLHKLLVDKEQQTSVISPAPEVLPPEPDAPIPHVLPVARVDVGTDVPCSLLGHAVDSNVPRAQRLSRGNPTDAHPRPRSPDELLLPPTPLQLARRIKSDPIPLSRLFFERLSRDDQQQRRPVACYDALGLPTPSVSAYPYASPEYALAAALWSSELWSSEQSRLREDPTDDDEDLISSTCGAVENVDNAADEAHRREQSYDVARGTTMVEEQNPNDEVHRSTHGWSTQPEQRCSPSRRSSVLLGHKTDSLLALTSFDTDEGAIPISPLAPVGRRSEGPMSLPSFLSLCNGSDPDWGSLGVPSELQAVVRSAEELSPSDQSRGGEVVPGHYPSDSTLRRQALPSSADDQAVPAGDAGDAGEASDDSDVSFVSILNWRETVAQASPQEAQGGGKITQKDGTVEDANADSDTDIPSECKIQKASQEFISHATATTLASTRNSPTFRRKMQARKELVIHAAPRPVMTSRFSDDEDGAGETEVSRDGLKEAIVDLTVMRYEQRGSDIRRGATVDAGRPLQLEGPEVALIGLPRDKVLHRHSAGNRHLSLCQSQSTSSPSHLQPKSRPSAPEPISPNSPLAPTKSDVSCGTRIGRRRLSAQEAQVIFGRYPYGKEIATPIAARSTSTSIQRPSSPSPPLLPLEMLLADRLGTAGDALVALRSEILRRRAGGGRGGDAGAGVEI